MRFIKTNLLSVFALLAYFAWWMYVVFGFSKKEYDNHYAGAIAVEWIVFVSVSLFAAYTTSFLIAALITKKWKKYLLFITIVFIPLLSIYVIRLFSDK